MHDEAALHVVENTEVLTRLLERDDVLEARWEGWVGAHLVINLDDALHGDEHHLTAR